MAAPAELHVLLREAPSAAAAAQDEGGAAAAAREYHLVAADLRDVQGLEEALGRAAFDAALPTLFVSECVLIYMDAELSAPLLAWAAATCGGSSSAGAGCAFVAYEQLRPHDPFGRTMVANLERRGCALKSLAAHPLPSAQVRRFERAGWKRARCRDMNSTYYGFLPSPLVASAARREIFDEVEEWHLIMAHYGLVVATTGEEGEANALADALGFFEGQGTADDDDGSASVPASAGRFTC